MASSEDASASPVAASATVALPALDPAQAYDPLVGSVLADRYEILRRIGEGGMGAVYEARHRVIGKRVAIKVLLEKLQQKPDLVARLLQEARLASSIGHENIVDVTDFGTTAQGRAFVVMEFLEGEPLAALVAREAPLPVERSLRIARQVAGALGAAHDKGIVHRDVKPENVYLVQRGAADFVKVVDFGVSKAIEAREEGTEWQRLTRTGMVLGTPLYMSPEHARGGEDVDARADVWAVGVMLYECLTGEAPFRARNALGIISQVLTGEAAPPSELRPELGIPPAVDALVMRALVKDRDRRVQTMAEMESALARLLGESDGAVRAPDVARPPRGARSGPRWHLLVTAVAVIAAGLVLALAGRDQRPRPDVSPASSPMSTRASVPPPVPARSVPATARPAVAEPRTGGVPPETRAAAPAPPEAAVKSSAPGRRPTARDRARAPEAPSNKVGDDIGPTPEDTFGARP